METKARFAKSLRINASGQTKTIGESYDSDEEVEDHRYLSYIVSEADNFD